MRIAHSFISGPPALLLGRPPPTSPTLSSSSCSSTSLRMPSGDLHSRGSMRNPATLPSALDNLAVLSEKLTSDSRRVVFFLDYDGTLSPIVEDPDSATIPELTRQALSGVAKRFTTAIVSGRSKDKVMNMVQVDSLIYAGSHGFDIEGPKGIISKRVAADWVPRLQKAAEDLRGLVGEFEGSSVEDNLLSVSFHYRKVDAALIGQVDKAVDEVVRRHGLRRTVGKCVFEVRPVFDWHKGKAVEYLLGILEGDGEVLPIYIGDDVTDEDAFKVLKGRGISVIVAEEGLERGTHADMKLKDPFEVQRFLCHFAKEGLPMQNGHVEGDAPMTHDVSVASE